MTPTVRVVVLNFNGGELVQRCVESLRALDWPREQLRIVVVDNASTDGSAEALRGRFPEIEVVASPDNLGFARGNNLALRDLDGVDYVALLNNDAWVEPGWLGPLVQALEDDPGLGAASPKILFAPSFVEIELEAPGFRPGGADPRELAVRLSGIEIDGADRLADSQFGSGWYGPEVGSGPEQLFRWMAPHARLRVPATAQARIRLAAEREKRVTATSGGEVSILEVAPDPEWHDVSCGGSRLNIVNNVGSEMIAGGYGGDRGFQQVDEGQYDQAAEVFAWCGCSVLLRRAYLEEVGIFDPRLFVYYEDFDLSWRGRARGWRYLYVPSSIVRHVHAASTVENSPFFVYEVERNRLIVHAKNAPGRYAWRAFLESVIPTARFAVRDIVGPAPSSAASASRTCVAEAARAGRLSPAAAGRALGAPRPSQATDGRGRPAHGLAHDAMKIAVYDEHWRTSGGGEKYAASFAEALADEHEVDLLGPAPIAPGEIGERLGVDLQQVGIRTLPGRPGALTAASADYDLLLNCSYMSTEACAARRGVYVVHFPTPFDHDLSTAKRALRRTLGPIVRRGHGSVELGAGYHLPEQARLRTYRWTSGLASFVLRLPAGRTLPVSLVLGGRPQGTEPARLDVRVDGEHALNAVIPSGERSVRVTFPAEGPSNGRAVGVELAVANPFVPGTLGLGHDGRELGIKLFSIQVGEGLGAWIGRFAPLLALPPASLVFLDTYARVVANSSFTGEWVRRLWGRESDVVYPSVPPIAGADKRPLILSVGRFFEPRRGHSKKQLEMVRAFRRLMERGLEGWEYRLVGGCHPEDEPYLAAVRREAAGLPVSIEIDASGNRLRELYSQARVFLHATGLGELEDRRPWRLEHFGIAVVEAMSAGVVPVVYGRGGPKEIVVPGESGLHFLTADELVERTLQLAADDGLERRLAEGARSRAKAFSPEAFRDRVRSLVAATLAG